MELYGNMILIFSFLFFSHSVNFIAMTFIITCGFKQRFQRKTASKMASVNLLYCNLVQDCSFPWDNTPNTLHLSKKTAPTATVATIRCLSFPAVSISEKFALSTFPPFPSTFDPPLPGSATTNQCNHGFLPWLHWGLSPWPPLLLWIPFLGGSVPPAALSRRVTNWADSYWTLELFQCTRQMGCSLNLNHLKFKFECSLLKNFQYDCNNLGFASQFFQL